MSSLGEKIRKLRMSRKMTQSDLAKKLDVTTSTISFYENNMRLPSYEVLIKLSRLFNTTTDSLLQEERNGIYFDTDSLTDAQVKILYQLVNMFKSGNSKESNEIVKWKTLERNRSFKAEKLWDSCFFEWDFQAK